MNNNKKVIYYKDELNDEFAGDSIKARPIDTAYWYGDSSFYFKLMRLFWYRIIAFPLATAFMKLKYHHKIENRSVIYPYKKESVFIYANHTNNIADALIPSLVSFPHSTYVVVNANNVSMPLLGKITPYLGALPLPDNMTASKNFMNTIKLRVSESSSIMIYPEAHIWPFYTKIRPFTDLSFRYPIQYKCPTFCFTNTYQKRPFSNKPKIVTYVDGPFFPDEKLDRKERQADLRNRVYEKMQERSKNNNIELIKYIKEI
ncbi:MAG: 1-acyl-sn-glycerol-3-phosphate acyltransferase [Treponema sp.]|nr:1-acyl-sn-glycerol-3-phosphate acyltransferase [Treponema sp.]